MAEKVHLDTSIGSNPAGKISAIVAGMIVGADSIDDINVIRHGGMAAMFDWVYAPSTLGSFLREFTHGHVRQVQSAGRELLVQLVGRTPVLAGADPGVAPPDAPPGAASDDRVQLVTQRPPAAYHLGKRKQDQARHQQ